MPADRSAVAAWQELEDAVGRLDWAAASKLAQEFEGEWNAVRGFVEMFAGPDGETWGHLVDKAMKALVEALSARPVDSTVVDTAMSRFRMFMR
ncbi:MAG: hypothetical protein ACRBN8_44930 [Nannocystales bacterium]